MDTYLIDLVTNPNFFKSPVGTLVLTVILIWSLSWKGSALWHASKQNDKFWFISLLILNTMGILEIAYLFYFSKNKINSGQAQKNILAFFEIIKKSLSKNSTK